MPTIAIITPNTLTALCLRYLLQRAMPALDVSVYVSWEAAEQECTQAVAHVFVDEDMYPPPHQSSLKGVRMILLTKTTSSRASFLPSLPVDVPEFQMLHELISIMRQGHFRHHAHAINASPLTGDKVLTPREKEVLLCVVKGMINKEIADHLHISMTTVITHRQHITRKLQIKSVSGLTLYAIVNGLVDPMLMLAR